MPKATQEVMEAARKELQAAQGFKEQLRKEYSAEERVPIYLSPMYAAYFGKVMRVMINGVSIYVKIDGSTQLVPQTFADEITRRRMAVDASLTKQGRMSDVANNAETAPGELALF